MSARTVKGLSFRTVKGLSFHNDAAGARGVDLSNTHLLHDAVRGLSLREARQPEDS